MYRQGEEIHVSTQEARGGATPHVMRYVLGISMLLAMAALSFVWISGAIDNPDKFPAAEVAAPAKS